jgi:hypothetical protein
MAKPNTFGSWNIVRSGVPQRTPQLGETSRDEASKWAVAAGVAGLVGVLALVNYMTKPKV